MTRALSNRFQCDLTRGFLAPLTAKVRRDDTLMLALRGGYINVYYRGGSILRLVETGDGSYQSSFDEKYNKNGVPLPARPSTVSTDVELQIWIDAFKFLKEAMDETFANVRKSEREFQQLVSWENNRSALAKETDYFITDIEYADVENNARLDMLGLKWLTTDRQKALKCRPAFIEMKYGDGALTGTSGLSDHIDQLRKILSDASRLDGFCRMIGDQFEQLHQMGMIPLERSARFEGFTFGKPEVVILLANHNPRSKTLLRILEGVKEPEEFDLRFFVASLAGYAMHEACMLSLDELRAHLARE